MNNRRLGLIPYIILTAIITFISMGIYFQTKDSIKTSSNIDYDDDWINDKVSMSKQLNSKWHWRYMGGKRSFIQVCSPSWSHSSVYHVNDKLITFYENKKKIGSNQHSYLRNNKGKILYIVETGVSQNVIINHHEIYVKFVIKNGDGNIVAYVPDISFINNGFTIHDMNNDPIITLSLDTIYGETKWTFNRIKNNTLPLALPIGMASKISFDLDKGTDGRTNSDRCGITWYISLILMVLFTSLTALFSSLLIIYKLYKKYVARYETRENTNIL